jgi:hypothetical protein
MSGLYVEFPYVQSSGELGSTSTGTGAAPVANTPNLAITGTNGTGVIIDSPVLHGDATLHNVTLVHTTPNTNTGVGSLVVGAGNSSAGSTCLISGQLNESHGNKNEISGANNITALGVHNMHVEGSNNTQSAGGDGHLEGNTNSDNGYYNHVEGTGNIVSGTCNVTHVEGNQQSVTACNRSHIEGQQNTVNGELSHTQGLLNTTNGRLADNSGEGNTAKFNQHVVGRFAVVDPVVSTTVPVAGQLVEIVGWGVDAAHPKSIRTLDAYGTQYIAGSLKTDGDTLQLADSQPMFSGNKLFEWNYQSVSASPEGDYANLSLTGYGEQNFLVPATAGRNGFLPVLTPGFLLNGFGGFKFDVRLGMWILGSTDIWRFRLYLGSVVIVEHELHAAYMTGLNLNEALCGSFKCWVDPIAYLAPGTGARLRAHSRFDLSLQTHGNITSNTAMFATESETYSNLDATASQGFTASWELISGNAGSQIFIDGVSIYV